MSDLPLEPSNADFGDTPDSVRQWAEYWFNEAAVLRAVLRGYEAWEASIILGADWSNATPLMTQGQFDQMIELQSQRNAALAKEGSDA